MGSTMGVQGPRSRHREGGPQEVLLCRAHLCCSLWGTSTSRTFCSGVPR